MVDLRPASGLLLKTGFLTRTSKFQINNLWFVFDPVSHTENVGKKQLLLSCQISPLFWHRKFHKPEM
jgi:hypothetical protein